MSWFTDIGDYAADLYDDSWLEQGFDYLSGSSSPSSTLTAPDIVGASRVTGPSLFGDTVSTVADTAGDKSFWDYALSAPVLTTAVSGVGQYLNASRQADIQDKNLAFQQQRLEQQDKLAQIKMLAELESMKYSAQMRGASGGGGGGDRTPYLLQALNNGATARLTALNNLASNYSYARGRR